MNLKSMIKQFTKNKLTLVKIFQPAKMESVSIGQEKAGQVRQTWPASNISFNDQKAKLVVTE